VALSAFLMENTLNGLPKEKNNLNGFIVCKPLLRHIV